MFVRHAFLFLLCTQVFCSQENRVIEKDRNEFSENHVNFLFVTQTVPEYPLGEKVLLGILDVPLSEAGKKQALQLKDVMQRSGILFDRVIASGLKRAYQTAEILAGNDRTVETDAAFNETSKGDLEGLTPHEYRQKPSYLTYKAISDPKESFFAPLGEGGETKAQAAVKMIQSLNAMRCNPDLKGKTVVVITHGNPLKILYTLSQNPKSVESNNEKELYDSLSSVSHLEEHPGSGVMVYYRADESSLQYIGRVEWEQQETIKINTDPFPTIRE